MSNQEVDILLPYWGDVELFKKTVDSILLQTNKNWSLKIFDDHYPSDEAQKYIESINDSRITYHRHDKNLGITKNFNFALSMATSPYFVMPGCDDVFLPNYIETSLAEIKDADFYQPKVQIIDLNGTIYFPLADRVKSYIARKPGIHEGEKLAISLCHGDWLYFPSILWRTEVVKKYGFNNKYKIAEDLDLELQMILDGAKLSVGKTPAFQYRRSAESLSSKEKGKDGIRFTEEDEVYIKFSKKFKEKGWKKASVASKIRFSSRVHKVMSN